MAIKKTKNTNSQVLDNSENGSQQNNLSQKLSEQNSNLVEASTKNKKPKKEKLPKKHKFKKEKTKKNADDVNADNSQNETTPPKKNSSHKKQRKLIAPTLIKLYYKRNKLRKLHKNYGANFSDEARYCRSLILAQNYIQRKNEEHEAEVKKRGRKRNKKENKKKKWLNFLYFGLNVLVIAVVLALQLSSEPNPEDSITMIFSANLWFLLCALGMVFVCIISDQIRYAFLLRKTTGRYRILLSYKLVAVGRYYDVITPLSVGGQPFQIFYANRYGVKAGDGISVITAKYVFQQITYFAVTSYILFRNLIKNTLVNSGLIEGGIQNGIVTTLSWIGYAVTALLILTIVFMSLNKRLGSRLVGGVFKLFSKIKIGKFKIIKDHNKSFISTMKTVNSWQVTTKKYFRSPIILIVNFVSSLVGTFASYSIPFFIYCAFAGWQPDAWLDIVTMAVIVELSSAFNPIPMGIGTADLGFKVLYGALFAIAGVSSAFVWAYIIWRVLVYYIYIIQGLGVITYDYIIGNKKLAKYKDYWLLPFKERCKITKDAFLRKNKKNL